MRVMHLIARFNKGGTATWISNLAESQINNQYQILVCAGYVSEGEKEDERFNDLSGKHISGLGRDITFFGDFIALLEIRKLIKEFRPDVLNTHTAKAGVLGRLAALSLFSKRPTLVHTLHGHLLTGYFGRLGTIMASFIERSLSKVTDLTLFAGERVRDDCLKVGIGTRRESSVVMPGVKEPITISQVSARSELHLELGSEVIYVGWLARIAPIKRIDRLMEIALQFPEISFLIGGMGENYENIVKNAPSNCIFLGWIDSTKFWSACDIALLTSDNEALPISLIEAQLTGIPTVTTPAGSAIEVVLDGVNGYVTDFSIPSLVSALRKLIASPSLRKEMGYRGRERARMLFSIERQFRDHHSAYTEAINARKN